MSEFKWVPEVGMKVKVGSVNDPDYIGVLLPEHSDPEHPKSEVVILSERRKKILSWLLPCVQLNPVGKKSEKHYAKAKKEWEDAQVIGVGDWVERIATNNSSVKVGDILKCIESAFGFICVNNESPDERHFAEYFRKLTPAEVEAHEASLVPEFEVGDYIVRKSDDKKKVSKITSQAKGHYHLDGKNGYVHSIFLTGFCRHATAEEIKAATRSVWNLEYGDQCFHLLSEGDIVDMIWVGSALEFHRRERGHVFLTREEAEAEDARRVAANKEVAA